MHFSTLAFAFLLPLGTLSLGTQRHYRSPHAPTEDKVTVNVNCHDQSSQHTYDQCYASNTAYQCASKNGSDRAMCDQLWQITCGRRAGCTVSVS
ncbi:hypothetical protein F4820DRAFT_469996 [Hypoxylon rubiginosum]|uniref:Uncharacterized protein n=1 Tax=Hypoxylon rubiginosum TaxID=110542 RepID=A0ACB9Z1D3_9PEZI|nr:hypothetical protein F4820DRAFT_469996 [Hypoxylon rubiginosum]